MCIVVVFHLDVVTLSEVVDLHFASTRERIGKSWKRYSQVGIIIDVHYYSTNINTDATRLIPSCSEPQINSIIE